MIPVPVHTLDDDGAGNFVVKVGGDVAGTVAQDGEFPGLWEIWGQNGTLMGRATSREDAGALLAAWFIADEVDRS